MDQTNESLRAAVAAHDLLLANPQARLYVLYVTRLYPAKFGCTPLFGMDYETQVVSGIKESLSSDLFAHSMRQVRFIHRKGVEPAQVICQSAAEYDCDLIIVGSRGKRFFSRILAGSVSHEVLQKSNIPVLVVRDRTTGNGAEGPLPRAGRVVSLATRRRI